jgi:hypothetical protein
MELLEMIGWIAIGFVPTYGVLVVASRKLMAIRSSLMAQLGGELEK